jgi:hypothetical protein
MPADDKNVQVDGLLRLSEQQYNDYKDRCSLEWKVSIALWTLLAALGAAELGSHPKPLGPWALIVLFAIPIHFIWQVKILSSHFERQKKVKEYQLAAAHLIEFDQIISEAQIMAPEGEAYRYKGLEKLGKIFRHSSWWLIVVISTTTIISAVVVRLAW